MAIAGQFSGLPMDQLIGAPLRAAADASTQLANSTAAFINEVGFDNQNKIRTASFGYQMRSVNEDGTSNLDEMKVEVPILAIVPIPNLQIDEVNILFDMEVKQSEKSEQSTDGSMSLSGQAKFGPVKVSVSGSVSVHSSNTRSTDNSAKYHVDVRATNHGTPEGLSRVLDMMAANIAPMLVGSEIKDGNGQELSSQSKAKAERLKTLRSEVRAIETRLDAANNSLTNNISRLKKAAVSQQNAYQSILNGLRSQLDGETEESAKTASEYDKALDEVAQSWTNLRNQAEDLIKLVADSGEESADVSAVFALKAFTKEGKATEYTNDQQYYAAIAAAQKSAVAAQKTYDSIEQELLDKKAEYNDAVSGKSQGTLPDNG
jgi:uncharacterized membrane-anchored protein YhcB (DUF1043 family)